MSKSASRSQNGKYFWTFYVKNPIYDLSYEGNFDTIASKNTPA